MSVINNNNVLIDQLKVHFGLNSDPFSPLAPVFYEGAQRQHNLETLRHLSTFGDMVLLLTGDKGSGKSAIISGFERSHESEINVFVLDIALIDSNSKVQPAIQALAKLADLLVIEGEPPQQTLNRLTQYFEQQFQANGHRAFLVIDNAERLPKKELQLYFSFFRDLPPESGVVILFSGQPSLLQYAKLGSNIGREEWIHQIHVKPLSGEDLVPYLQLRLESAGFKEVLTLSDAQQQHLIDVGKGLPGRINRIFSSVVLEPGLLKIARTKKTGVPQKIVFGIASLLLMSFLIVSHQHGLLDTILEKGVVEKFEPLVDSQEPMSSRGIESGKAIESELSKRQRQERLDMLDRAIAKSVGGATLKAEIVSGVVSDSHRIEPEQDADIQEEVAAQIDEVVGLNANSGISADPALESELEPRAGLSSAVTLDRAGKEEAVASKAVALEQADAPDDKSGAGLGEQSRNEFFRARAWVSGQSVTDYSAQILGSYKEETALKFIGSLGSLKHEVFYLKTLHKGKSWYVVFYGLFSTKSAAQKAVADASKAIRSQNPWLRRLDGVLKSYPMK